MDQALLDHLPFLEETTFWFSAGTHQVPTPLSLDSAFDVRLRSGTPFLTANAPEPFDPTILVFNRSTSTGTSGLSFGSEAGATLRLQEVTLTEVGQRCTDDIACGSGGLVSSGEGTASLVMDNVKLEGGSALVGGGIDWTEGAVTLRSVSVVGAESGWSGGAMSFNRLSSLSLSDLVVRDNHVTGTGSGGGVFVSLTEEISVERTTIEGCSATLDAGGFYIADPLGVSTMTFSDVILSGNSAGADGAGMLVKGASGTRVIFTGIVEIGNNLGDGLVLESTTVESQAPLAFMVNHNTGNGVSCRGCDLSPLLDNDDDDFGERSLNGNVGDGVSCSSLSSDDPPCSICPSTCSLGGRCTTYGGCTCYGSPVAESVTEDCLCTVGSGWGRNEECAPCSELQYSLEVSLNPCEVNQTALDILLSQQNQTNSTGTGGDDSDLIDGGDGAIDDEGDVDEDVLPPPPVSDGGIPAPGSDSVLSSDAGAAALRGAAIVGGALLLLGGFAKTTSRLRAVGDDGKPGEDGPGDDDRGNSDCDQGNDAFGGNPEHRATPVTAATAATAVAAVEASGEYELEIEVDPVEVEVESQAQAQAQPQGPDKPKSARTLQRSTSSQFFQPPLPRTRAQLPSDNIINDLVNPPSVSKPAIPRIVISAPPVTPKPETGLSELEMAALEAAAEVAAVQPKVYPGEEINVTLSAATPPPMDETESGSGSDMDDIAHGNDSKSMSQWPSNQSLGARSWHSNQTVNHEMSDEDVEEDDDDDSTIPHHQTLEDAFEKALTPLSARSGRRRASTVGGGFDEDDDPFDGFEDLPDIVW